MGPRTVVPRDPPAAAHRDRLHVRSGGGRRRRKGVGAGCLVDHVLRRCHLCPRTIDRVDRALAVSVELPLDRGRNATTGLGGEHERLRLLQRAVRLLEPWVGCVHRGNEPDAEGDAESGDELRRARKPAQPRFLH